VAIALAICAALCNALTTIFQRLGVETAPDPAEHGLGLLWHAVRRPVWIFGLLMMVGSFGFQAAALGFGSLSVVQPLMPAELVFLVVILRVWFKRTLGVREALGTALTVGGLSCFLALSDAGGGNRIPTGAEWVLVTAVCGGALLACMAMARTGSRTWRSAWFGASAAIAFAITAAFTKSTMTLLGHGIGQVFTHWEPYAIAIGGLIGLVLTQNSFHAGPITASQATLTIVDPIVSIVIGVGLFGDQLKGGVGSLALDALALVVMSGGLLVLSQSPLVAGAESSEALGPALRGEPERPFPEVPSS
jgi:drug/metabolite transporter (DMT)-like permease